MPRTLLITGGTGSVSSALRAALTGADFDIRVMIRDQARATPLRDQGVNVVVGDLGDPRSLPPAFEGVHDLWLLVADGPRAPEHSMNAVWAARQAGVERVVRLSAIGASHDAPTRSGRLHALSDRELQTSGLCWTILRPHWFMQNLFNEASDISAQGTISLNAGGGRLGMIDVRDIAQFAVQVLTDRRQNHDGKTYTPTGPRSLSFADVAGRLTEVLGRPIKYVPRSDEGQRRALLARGVPAWIADMVIEYARAYATGWGNCVTTDFLDIVGRPPRSIDEFIRDHLTVFSSPDAHH